MAFEPRTPDPATADMAAARRRSAHYGLDPASSEIPHIGDPGPSADALRQLSAPVLDRLLSQIADSSLGVVLADREGRLTRRDAATSTTLAAMDSRSLDLGFSLAEPAVGTNGVGTSLETKRPTVVIGEDHFLESFKSFTCANAPIVHPVTRRVEGTVGVLCPAEDTGPLILSTVLQLSSQIRELLLESATPEERFLLERFLRSRTNPTSAVATIGERVLIASPAAQRLLAGIDHVELSEHIEAATRQGRPFETNFERPSDSPLRLRCRPLHRGGELGGVAVEFVSERPTVNRTRRRPSPQRLGDLVGVSDGWQTMIGDALQASQLHEPVFIVGERGTGRFSVATAIAERGAARVEVFDSAEVLVEGSRQWTLRVRAALSSGATVLLRRIDELPNDVAAAIASVVAGPADGRVIATTGTAAVDHPGQAALIDQLNVLRIDISPLRSRRDDIPVIANHLGVKLGRHHIDRRVINVLYRQPWNGNVTELRQVLRSAHARARSEPLAVHHLPRQVRNQHNRKPLHGLRQQEADAIVAAVGSTTTRAAAAEQLGISRATLFRRIKDYGIDLDR